MVATADFVDERQTPSFQLEFGELRKSRQPLMVRLAGPEQVMVPNAMMEPGVAARVGVAAAI